MTMENNIRFTSSVNEELNKIIAGIPHTSLFVLVDENTKKHCLPLLDLPSHKLIEIKSGEKNKNLETISHIWMALSQDGADRKSLLINIGGGLLTDVGGFAASCFKRGIKFINIPTTLLSQVDASIGGKTGINFNGLKNEIGVFNTPEYVLLDTCFLATLEKDEFMSGVGEMLKHGLIKSEVHFDSVINFDYENYDPQKLLELIKQSVEIKSYFVENDFTENSIRKVLNFGHTISHALESYAHEKKMEFKHGELVAIGAILELELSKKLFGFDELVIQKLRTFVQITYKEFSFPLADLDSIMEYMLHDKKNQGKQINFTMLKAIGDFEIDKNLDPSLIRNCLVENLKLY